MSNHLKFYIDGAWVDPATPRTLDVINPATEEPFTRISIGSTADVDRAVAAARAAFPKFSQSGKAERVALLKRIVECYRARMNDIAQAVSAEMGAPIGMALTIYGLRLGKAALLCQEHKHRAPEGRLAK